MKSLNSKKSLTDVIFESDAPWDNPYQGTDTRVLFVCSAGILRSATGARLYAGKYNTRAAGSESYALIPVTDNLIAWANVLVFVNQENYESVAERYDMADLEAHGKTIRVLDIPDQYEHMAPQLVSAFSEQFESITNVK